MIRMDVRSSCTEFLRPCMRPVRPAYSQIAYGKLFSPICQLSNLVGLWFRLGLELVLGLGLG